VESGNELMTPAQKSYLDTPARDTVRKSVSL
jgi:hypothetical protein